MMTDPLAGFVLFKNTPEVIQLTIGRGYVRISNDALRLIGDPEAINVFFDEPNKRMAVKAATDKMPNVFKMNKRSGLGKCSTLLEEILRVSEVEWHPGEVIRFSGRKYSSDYVIFDLAKSKIVKYDDHVSERNKTRKRKEAA